MYETDATRLAEVKDGITKLEQQVSTTMGRIQVIEAKRKAMLDGRAMVSSKVQSTARDEQDARERVSRLETALSDAEGELRDAASKRTSYEEEMKTPLRQSLTAGETKDLERLTKEADAQKTVLIKATEARQEVRQLGSVGELADHIFRSRASGAAWKSNLRRACVDGETSSGDHSTTWKGTLALDCYGLERWSCARTSSKAWSDPSRGFQSRSPVSCQILNEFSS